MQATAAVLAILIYLFSRTSGVDATKKWESWNDEKDAKKTVSLDKEEFRLFNELRDAKDIQKRADQEARVKIATAKIVEKEKRKQEKKNKKSSDSSGSSSSSSSSSDDSEQSSLKGLVRSVVEGKHDDDKKKKKKDKKDKKKKKKKSKKDGVAELITSVNNTLRAQQEAIQKVLEKAVGSTSASSSSTAVPSIATPTPASTPEEGDETVRQDMAQLKGLIEIKDGAIKKLQAEVKKLKTKVEEMETEKEDLSELLQKSQADCAWYKGDKFRTWIVTFINAFSDENIQAKLDWMTVTEDNLHGRVSKLLKPMLRDIASDIENLHGAGEAPEETEVRDKFKVYVQAYIKDYVIMTYKATTETGEEGDDQDRL